MRPVSLAILVLIVVLAAAAPLLGLRDPAAQPDGLVLADLPPLARVHAVHLANGDVVRAHAVARRPDGSVALRRGPRWRVLPPQALARGGWHERELYLLGTDGYGRDLLSRALHGGRVSLAIGAVAALLAVALGAVVGMAAGLVGGVLDGLLMRLADVVAAVPRLFLLLLLATLWQPSPVTTALVVGTTGWLAAARIVRGEVLRLREEEFVRAARAAGASARRLAWRHLLPGASGPLAAEGAFRVGQSLLLEASLSFLGVGVPPPLASWGTIIADGRDRLATAPWIATVPGVLIALTVVALTRLADLSFDPRVLARPTQRTWNLTKTGSSSWGVSRKSSNRSSSTSSAGRGKYRKSMM